MASVPLKVLRGRKDRIIRELNKKQVKMCLSLPRAPPPWGGVGKEQPGVWKVGVLGRLTEPEGWPTRLGWGGQGALALWDPCVSFLLWELGDHLPGG